MSAARPTPHALAVLANREPRHHALPYCPDPQHQSHRTLHPQPTRQTYLAPYIFPALHACSSRPRLALPAACLSSTSSPGPPGFSPLPRSRASGLEQLPPPLPACADASRSACSSPTCTACPYRARSTPSPRATHQLTHSHAWTTAHPRTPYSCAARTPLRMPSATHGPSTRACSRPGSAWTGSTSSA